MEVNVRKRGEFKVLDIEGDINEVDNYTLIRDIIETAIQKGEHHIALNLANTTFLNSGAVSVFISCHKKLNAAGGNLVIVEPPETILEILRILCLDQIISVYKNENQFLKKADKGKSN